MAVADAGSDTLLVALTRLDVDHVLLRPVEMDAEGTVADVIVRDAVAVWDNSLVSEKVKECCGVNDTELDMASVVVLLSLAVLVGVCVSVADARREADTLIELVSLTGRVRVTDTSTDLLSLTISVIESEKDLVIVKLGVMLFVTVVVDDSVKVSSAVSV